MNPYAYDVRSRAGVGLNGIEISVGVHIYQTISALTLRMTAGAWWRFFFTCIKFKSKVHLSPVPSARLQKT
jgi:hypothetical protein